MCYWNVIFWTAVLYVGSQWDRNFMWQSRFVTLFDVMMNVAQGITLGEVP
jgi:hypothetical protein